MNLKNFKNNGPSVTKLIINDRIFSVYIERTSEGWHGYVIEAGEFFCAVPTRPIRYGVLTEAENQIRQRL